MLSFIKEILIEYNIKNLIKHPHCDAISLFNHTKTPKIIKKYPNITQVMDVAYPIDNELIMNTNINSIIPSSA